MRRHILFATTLLACLNGLAQQPFKGILENKKEDISLNLNLYEENITVPGMDFFGPCHGYMHGNIYGIWTITSSRINDGQTAVIRLSNDQGSDTQEVELSVVNDSTILFRQKGKVTIKKVVNRKLVKIPSEFHLVKKP
ncbi:MAG: hypothetical protein NC388_06995 [Clostridium sp.]|nr:hypothetical protein [Clostridium sp.]